MSARQSWKAIYSDVRRARAIDGDAWAIIARHRGIERGGNPWADWHALQMQSCLAEMVRRRPTLAAALAYDVLNHFGTTNPFRFQPRTDGRWNRSNRAHKLREKMRARGMLDIEPGNYVALRGHSIHMESVA